MSAWWLLLIGVCAFIGGIGLTLWWIEYSTTHGGWWR